jgi:hypothetical protein
MGRRQLASEGSVGVPRRLILEAISALRLGEDAVLDRDWECYSESEHEEARNYATDTFARVAKELQRLLEN